jgi:hypothetical protein
MIWWRNSVLRMIGIPEGVDELLSCECCSFVDVLLWTNFEALSNSVGTQIFVFFSLLHRYWLLKAWILRV